MTYQQLQKAWRHGEQFYCTSCGSQFERDTENHFVSGTKIQQHMEQHQIDVLSCASCGNVLVQKVVDLSVRGFSGDEYASLKRKASEAGKSLEAWARSVLIAAAQEPAIRTRYVLRANTGPVYVEIRRTEDGLSDIEPFYFHGKTVEQIASIEHASQLVKRNGPGDREAASAALARGFENVRESLV